MRRTRCDASSAACTALCTGGWLTGTIEEVPPAVWKAFELATDAGHTAMQAELCGYLRRAGHDVTAPDDVPGPWALSLAGRSREAAAAWGKLGERNEQAVEQTWSGEDDQARVAGLGILKELGATATVARVLARRALTGRVPGPSACADSGRALGGPSGLSTVRRRGRGRRRGSRRAYPTRPELIRASAPTPPHGSGARSASDALPDRVAAWGHGAWSRAVGLP